MKIDVTAEDIREARGHLMAPHNNGAKSFTHCPVALAFKHTNTRDKEVWVGSKSARVGGALVSLPREVTKFIDAFDDGKDVQPFSFELEI